MMNRRHFSQRTTRFGDSNMWNKWRLRTVLTGVLFLALIASSCSSDNATDSTPGPVDLATDYFVSIISGSDTATGSRSAPMATIQAAIDAATATGGRVFVAEGVYAETITIVSGVSIFGGYSDVTFVRNTSLVTTINGSTMAITLTNADSVTIDGFTINSANATATGGSSIGVVLNSSTVVVITNNVITAGNGFAGADGTDGVDSFGGNGGFPGPDALFTITACPVGGSGASSQLTPPRFGGYGGYGGTNILFPGHHGNDGVGVGGQGGGGGGGPSVVMVEDASSSSTRSNNSFTPGSRGGGGTSSDFPGANGLLAGYLKL